MDSHSQSPRFLRLLLLSFAGTCLAAALLNFLVDPYGIFGSPRLSGFNELKPRAAERVRVAKPYMAEATTAYTIVGGNSRPEIGLDPQSDCWAPGHRPVFNMGIPGASFRLQTEYVQHAAMATGARRVLLAVDFADFLVNVRSRAADGEMVRSVGGDALRLTHRANHGDRLKVLAQRTKDRLNGLFSLETLGDSLLTLSTQHNANSSTRQSNGFNPARDYLPIIQAEGQAVLFRQKNSEVAVSLRRPGLGLYWAGTRDSEPLKALRSFLQWADGEGIEVVVFVNPYHAHYLTLIELAGKWGLLEQWKREILAITSAAKVPLWDFNAFDDYSSESPPGRRDVGRILRWFWEPAHYRKEFGNLMLASLEGQPCGPALPSAEVGLMLTETNLDNHLATLRRALDTYRAAHTDEYRLLSSLMQRDG